MESYIKLKRSHCLLLKDTPLFMLNNDKRFVLYKSENKSLDNFLYAKPEFPELYIRGKDRQQSIAEITHALNIKLYQKLKSNGLKKVKEIFIELFDESVSDLSNRSLDCLPETIEMVFKESLRNSDMLLQLTKISNKHYSLAEHSANVMFFVMNYCIHCNCQESEVRRLSLSGLLHDVGKIHLPDHICIADHFLTDDEYNLFKSHTTLGHDTLEKNNFKDSIAIGALEHHERLDGSGYPAGKTSISFEGQLLGIINSFEHITYREKSYRKAKRPFDAMSIIKDETLQQGKFDKEIFSDLCKSLVG